MSGSSDKAGSGLGRPGSTVAILALAAICLAPLGAAGQQAAGEPLRLLPADPVPLTPTAPLPPAVEVVPLDEPLPAPPGEPWTLSDRNAAAALAEELTGRNATEGMRRLIEAVLAWPVGRQPSGRWDRFDRARIRALALYDVADPLVRIVLDGRVPPDERSDSLLVTDALFAVDRIDQACSLVRERSRRWVDADWLARLALCRFLAERRDEAIEALRALDGFGGGDPELRAALAGLEARRAPANARAIASRDPATGALRAALAALGVADGGSDAPVAPGTVGDGMLGALDRAVQNGQRGEVALMSLLVLESTGPAGTPRPILERVLDRLDAAGWRAEAEAIARDASAGVPPT